MAFLGWWSVLENCHMFGRLCDTHLKGAHTKLVKRVFNYCHPYVRGTVSQNLKILDFKTIALQQYPSLEDCKTVVQNYS